MNSQKTNRNEQDVQRCRDQMETARALAMKILGESSPQELADLFSRIDQLKAAILADRQFEEWLRLKIKDDLERAEEMALRDNAIAQLDTLIRQTMTTDQVLGIQAFVIALKVGAISPAFFKLMADSFQASELTPDCTNAIKRSFLGIKRQRASR
ncbi:MAG: hypothetical protein RH946_00575 [Rhodospirillales bacterium]